MTKFVLSQSERILLIILYIPEELCDRDLIIERLERAQSALVGYERYIELKRDALDARDIRCRMINRHNIPPALH